jgi:hypothetical protein
MIIYYALKCYRENDEIVYYCTPYDMLGFCDLGLKFLIKEWRKWSFFEWKCNLICNKLNKDGKNNN